MKTLNILSLFDWMSAGQIALNKLWITNYRYFASEIDKYAIQVTQKNYPNTIQIWDITKICSNKWTILSDYIPQTNSKIDLLIWWSPCQWFSFAWKQLNFSDPRSALFFEYVRILKEVKPKFFILENVASAPLEAKIIMAKCFATLLTPKDDEWDDWELVNENTWLLFFN